MADAIIDRLSPTDLEPIIHLYNGIFRPARPIDWIVRRLSGRRGILAQVARIGRDGVGFYLGFELKPDTHFTWLVGVVPEMRRAGIATQLMHSAEDWARTEGHRWMRFECDNRIRGFLHFGIANEYDIVGLRWDPDRATNLVIFHKALTESLEDSSGTV